MKVDVYINLIRDCVSVRSRETEDYGTVVSQEQKVRINNPSFVVQESGRQRVIEDGIKNVHAFVRGEWDGSLQIVHGDYVTYDPFEHEQFYCPDMDSYVSEAEKCSVSRSGVFAEGLSK
jgi:hypothetical protein